MSSFDNLEELLDDLFDYGQQKTFGVTCSAPGLAERWGLTFDSLAEAEGVAAELAAKYGAPFRAITMVIDVKIVNGKMEG